MPGFEERNNPHPARGRKLQRRLAADVFLRNNSHPARGRKLTPLRANADQNRKQPTPRKGTETFVGQKYGLAKFLETIYTPQGDGNKNCNVQ